MSLPGRLCCALPRLTHGLTLLSLALRRVAAGLRGARSLVQIALALAGGCLLALVPVAGSGLTGLALHVTVGLVPVSRCS